MKRHRIINPASGGATRSFFERAALSTSVDRQSQARGPSGGCADMSVQRAAIARAIGRAGFSLVELTIASILLGTVMLTAIPTLAWINRVSQSAERQQAALLGAGNLMERLSARPWDEMTPETMAAITLPDDLARQLPGADLRITVEALPDNLAAKQLTIELRWEESSTGMKSPPVRLTAWVYLHGRGGA
jgi:Tfp pilus assembly protein PilV